MEMFDIEVISISPCNHYRGVEIKYINGWDIPRQYTVYVHDSCDVNNQYHLNVVAKNSMRGNIMQADYVFKDEEIKPQESKKSFRYNISVNQEGDEIEKYLVKNGLEIKRSKIYLEKLKEMKEEFNYR